MSHSRGRGKGGGGRVREKGYLGFSQTEVDFIVGSLNSSQFGLGFSDFLGVVTLLMVQVIERKENGKEKKGGGGN